MIKAGAFEQTDPSRENMRGKQVMSSCDESRPPYYWHLRDDMLKLVRYKILFAKREYEVAFPDQEDLVSDNRLLPSGSAEQQIGSSPEHDKKYVRVYFKVFDRHDDLTPLAYLVGVIGFTRGAGAS